MFAEKDRAAAESLIGVASKTVGQKKSMGGSVGLAVLTVGDGVAGVGLGEMLGLAEMVGDTLGAAVGAAEIVGVAEGVAVGLRVA